MDAVRNNNILNESDCKKIYNSSFYRNYVKNWPEIQIPKEHNEQIIYRELPEGQIKSISDFYERIVELNKYINETGR